MTYLSLWVKARAPAAEWTSDVFEMLINRYGDQFLKLGEYIDLNTKLMGHLSKKLRFCVLASPNSSKPFSRMLSRKYSEKNTLEYSRRLEEEGGLLEFGGMSLCCGCFCKMKPFKSTEITWTMRIERDEPFERLQSSIQQICARSDAVQFYVLLGRTASDPELSHSLTAWEKAAADEATLRDAQFSTMHADSGSTLRGISSCFGFSRSAFGPAYERTACPPTPWQAQSWDTVSGDSLRTLLLPQLQDLDPDSAETHCLEMLLAEELPAALN